MIKSLPSGALHVLTHFEIAIVKNEHLLLSLILLLAIPVASLHAADITLVEPGDYQVYQRTSPIAGVVRVRGAISDSQAAKVKLECRIVASNSHALRYLRDVPPIKWAEKVGPWLEMQLKAEVK